MRIRLGTPGDEGEIARGVADGLRARQSDLEIEETPFSFARGGATEDLTRALLADEIDLAVVALDDLLLEPPAGLVLAAVLPRDAPWDAWVSETAPDPVDLAPGARVLAGSLRARAQLLHRHPELIIDVVQHDLPDPGHEEEPSREESASDIVAAIVPIAHLEWLGHSGRARAIFTVSELTPAAGQGARGILARENDPAAGVAADLDDRAARNELTAEQAFLSAIGLSAAGPVGVLARVRGAHLSIVGVVAAPDGHRLLRLGAEGDAASPAEAGASLAATLQKAGGQEILDLLAEEFDVTPGYTETR